MLGHGAGGGVQAPDLVAVTARLQTRARRRARRAALPRAGRRSPPPAPRLDTAWTEVVERLRADELAGLPLVAGGRSSGARVACRTAGALGAAGVLCLAFPLEPPGGRPSRLAELEAVEVPVLVVQGEHDRFGIPPPRRRARSSSSRATTG